MGVSVVSKVQGLEGYRLDFSGTGLETGTITSPCPLSGRLLTPPSPVLSVFLFPLDLRRKNPFPWFEYR